MTPKIIVQLKGGIGNQMFQYAVGRSLAIKNTGELLLDTGFFQKNKKDTPRQYALGAFNLKAGFVQENDLSWIIRLSTRYRVGKFLYYLIKFFSRKYFKESSYNFFEKLSISKKDLYLEGNWQSQKYFIDISNDLKNEFSLKIEYRDKLDEKLLGQIFTQNSVSVHVRRGDYLTNPKALRLLGVCSESYYRQAIAEIMSLVKDPILFVFSDDIEWVKSNMKFPISTIYVSNGELADFEELTLMSYCKHNIIANSSFSWWGAWLNNNPNKIVIAPSNWFVDKKFNTIDLIPANWLKI